MGLQQRQTWMPSKLYRTAIVGVLITGAWLQGCNRGDSPDSNGPEVPISGVCDTFSDVPSDYWASPYIQASVELGVTAGYTLEDCVDGVAEFRPDAPVTRAEYAALLSQIFTQTEAAEVEPFPDVTDDYWAKAAIQDVAAKGFITGYDDGLFRPEQPVSRSEVLFALVKGLEYTPTGDVATTVSVYDDVDVFLTWEMGSTEALGAIAAATEQGIVVNYPDAAKLNPLQPATRAEVAATIYQALVSAGRAEAIQ